jgi:hypothetical protein
VPTAFAIDHDGRRIEVVPESTLTRDRLQLRIDGDLVAEVKPNGAKTVVEARHVVKGVAQAVAAIVGIGFAIRLLPDISLPVDLPDVPLPDIDPPSLALPGWVKVVMPVLLGLVIALREWRRRRPGGRHRDRGGLGDDVEGGPPARQDQPSGQGPVP